ncbi:ClpP-like prohead protease/major capsid protein fusion protein [Alloalcanivorax xenomutans]|uniref:ClpP-like prohead protease/major capsid protein fusion protein n=2 Tax=Alloalcanivorax xenomutans TaxID=1094342 RepID=UPI003BACEB2A
MNPSPSLARFARTAMASAVYSGRQLSATNRINAQGELLLYGVIGDWFDGLDAATIVSELESMSGENAPLPVRIHSEGGYITEGLAIYNALVNSPRRIDVRIDGIALSMASVVAMAGDVVRIPPNAYLMIHKPWNPIPGGDAEELRRCADVLDQFEDSLANIYSAKTGLDNGTIKAMMAAETWLNGEQAVELGFADELIEPVQAAAMANLNPFRNAPQVALQQFHRPPTAGGASAATAAQPQQPKGDIMTLEQRAKAVGLTRRDGETDAQLNARVEAAEAAAGGDGGGNSAEGAGDQGSVDGAQNRGGRQPTADGGRGGDNDSPPAATGAGQGDGGEAVAQAAVAHERQRISNIRALCRQHRMEDRFTEQLIEQGTGLDTARNQILDALAQRQQHQMPGGHVTVAGHDGEGLRTAMAAALMNRFDPRSHPLPDEARAYRGATLMDLARNVVEAGGGSVHGMSRMEIAAKALSTSDFPALLADVANKTLRQGYEAAPRTFQPFCRLTTASDFKYLNRAQLGEAPELEKVTESGEFRYGKMGEDNQRYRLETFGKIIGLTRQTIINDDLDAFSRVPQAFGASAAEVESNTVWGLITGNVKMADNKALFHSDHNNLGTAAPISVESLTEARKKMRRQMGLNTKRPLNLMAEFLIVPAALETEAQKILSEVLSAKSADVNPFAGTLTLIVEPRLDEHSEITWYLSAAPSRIDTIEYAYLAGEEGVYIETREGFHVDGVEIKARLDFGAGVIDHRGLFKNAGQ